MFNLEEEVKAWSRGVSASAAARSESADELIDHLLCKVEALQARGLSEEEAFYAATAEFGALELLASEHAKNRGAFARLEGKVRAMDRRAAGRANIGISLVFAALVLLSSRVFHDTESSQTALYALMALWSVPFLLLSSAGRSMKAEYACVTRRLGLR